MIRVIKQLLSVVPPLSLSQVEAVVSTSLAIPLAPVELRLERPSAQAFHTDLAALIARGAHHFPSNVTYFSGCIRPSRTQLRAVSACCCSLNVP